MTSERGPIALLPAGLRAAALIAAPAADARPTCQDAGTATICETTGSVSIAATPGTTAPPATRPQIPWWILD